MSDLLEVHPTHAWIIGLVADDARSTSGAADEPGGQPRQAAGAGEGETDPSGKASGDTV